jgi:chromosome partitioning protein
MKTIAIAAAKGGVCKTTITAMLAVRASQESPSVAMFDLNEDQGNLTQWWLLRGQMNMSPRLVTDLTNIPADAKRVAGEETDWLFIDTPPLEMDLIEQAIVISDFVLIPVRTSFFDVSAVEPVTAMCRKHRKPFAFVLAAVDNRFKVLIPQTLATLKPEGPILEQQISHRLPYIQAVTQGRTGAELSKDLTAETDALWLEVKKRTEAAAAPKVKGAAHA